MNAAETARNRRAAGVRPSLLFVNQHYWPDVASTGQHLTDLAEHLAGSGFRVRVICGQAGYRGGELEAPARERHNGVSIRRLAMPGFGREAGRQWGRAADYGAFHLKALGSLLLEGERPDLVVSLTTPSLLPATVRAACGLRRVPYAVWAMDLHPEIEQTLGVLRAEGASARALRRVGRAGYRRAEFVVTMGAHMARRVEEGKDVPAGRLHTIPVWNDGREVHPVAPGKNELRRELGYSPEDLVVMYSGNAGLAHRFDEVLEAAHRLRDRGEVHFLFVGDGPRRADIERRAAELRLPRFRYLDYFPREELARSLSVGDVHLLTLRSDMAGLCAPGKLYGILAAGRPVLMVGPARSDPVEVIRRQEVGRVLEPGAEGSGDGERLAGEILRMLEAPDRRRELGERARRVFLERFERESCCRQWEELLRVACGREPR